MLDQSGSGRPPCPPKLPPHSTQSDLICFLLLHEVSPLEMSADKPLLSKTDTAQSG